MCDRMGRLGFPIAICNCPSYMIGIFLYLVCDKYVTHFLYVLSVFPQLTRDIMENPSRKFRKNKARSVLHIPE